MLGIGIGHRKTTTIARLTQLQQAFEQGQWHKSFITEAVTDLIFL